MHRKALDAALIEAHEAEDDLRLVALYSKAADLAETEDDIAACCFYLTHSYVFALACGAPEAPALHARLLKYRREE